MTDEERVWIAALPERVWGLVTDVAGMGRFSPECTGGAWTHGATGPVAGARFTGRNRHGPVRWSTHCTVEHAEAPAAGSPGRFAFTARESDTRWTYELTPTDGGTELLERREPPARPPLVARVFTGLRLGGADRDGQMAAGMRATLERIRAVAEG